MPCLSAIGACADWLRAESVVDSPKGLSLGTFGALARCVLQANALPVFVNVDATTYTIHPAQVGQHVTTVADEGDRGGRPARPASRLRRAACRRRHLILQPHLVIFVV